VTAHLGMEKTAPRRCFGAVFLLDKFHPEDSSLTIHAVASQLGYIMGVSLIEGQTKQVK
jgi:hypothetical protein